jgi:hypothetical protein
LDIFLAIMQSVGKLSAARAELERSETQTIKKSNNNYFVETRALEESVEKSRNNSARAKKANETMRAKYGLDKAVPVAAPSPAEEIVFGLPKVSAPLLPGMAAARRKTLEYFFVHTCGAPEEDTWLRDGIVSGIMKHCQIPRGSSAEVKKVFKDILGARRAQKRYDEHAGERLRGKTPCIMDCTPQADVVYRALESGLSSTQATVILNMWQAARDLPAVSWSAVNGFVGRSTVVFRSRRVTKKSGKEDEGFTWALARLAECKQFLEQLRLGKLAKIHPEVV